MEIFIKVVSTYVALILLIGCASGHDLQEQSKIEYLRASDEISLRFLKESQNCLARMSGFNDFDVEPFAEYLLGEEYSNCIIELKGFVDEQRELNAKYDIPFRTKQEASKQIFLHYLASMRVYAEIINEGLREEYSVVIQDTEIQYSEFQIKKETVDAFKDYQENTKGFTLMMERMKAISTGGSLLDAEQLAVEKRLNSSDRVYRKMEIEAEVVVSQEMMQEYEKIIKDMRDKAEGLFDD